MPLQNLWAQYRKDIGVTTFSALEWDSAGSAALLPAAATVVQIGLFDPVNAGSFIWFGVYTVTGSETDAGFLNSVYNIINGNNFGFSPHKSGTKLILISKPEYNSIMNSPLLFIWNTGQFESNDWFAASLYVYKWEDQSGNNRHLTSVFGFEPKMIDSLVSKGDWNARMQTDDTFPIADEISTYVVGLTQSAINGFDRYVGAGTNLYICEGGGGAYPEEVTDIYRGVWAVKVVSDFSTLHSIRSIFKNDSASLAYNNDPYNVTYPSGQTYAKTGVTTDKLTLLSSSTGTNFGDKQIAEIRIYTSAHGDAETAQVEAELQQAYSLPYTVQPFVAAAPPSLPIVKGRTWMDGIDLWNYGVFVESGIDGFLKYPAKKDSISHDWLDANGTEVDLSKPFFQPRSISLNCALIASSEADFWTKYKALISHLMRPMQRRLEFAQFGNNQFFIYYNQCSNFTRFTRIKDGNKIACKFTLELVENEPKLDNAITFLMADSGTFLIT